MPKQSCSYQIPPPVPLLKPLAPPEYIIALCKQFKSDKKHTHQLEVIEQQDFKNLYEQKCYELIHEITKSKKYEELITELEDKNKELQSQIRRLQQQRWKGGYDYSRLSARGRSKSQKRVIPVIEVKVPHNEKQLNIKQFEQQRYYPTERGSVSHKILQYQRQLEKCKLQIKQLKEIISQNQLKVTQSQRSLKANFIPHDHEQKNLKKKQFSQQRSPEKYNISQLKYRHTKTPQINEFSPSMPYKDETVKKDTTYLQTVEIEIKRLKNQLLYKDLLINKLKEEKSKENDILQRHLHLSIQESKKINEQTTTILEKFKKEIVFLWKELQFQKSKNLNQDYKTHDQYVTRTKQNLVKNQPMSSLAAEGQNLLEVLRLRRNQRFQ